jgi:cysteine-rich repeat protein
MNASTFSFIIGVLCAACARPRAEMVSQGGLGVQAAGANSAPPIQPDEVPQRESPCGDGEVDADEHCDDGNRLKGDGCSPGCSLEAIGFVRGGVVLGDHTLYATTGANKGPVFPGRKVSTFTFSGAVLEGYPAQLVLGLGAYSRAVVPLPEGLAPVALIGGDRSWRVALADGQLWYLRETGDDWNCLSSGEWDREIHDKATRWYWCRVREAPKRIVSLTDDCWLEYDNAFACEDLSTKVGARNLVSISGMNMVGVCALTDLGEVGCWGYGEYGQLGFMGAGPFAADPADPEVFEADEPPTQFLRFSSPAVQLFAVRHKTYALLANGDLWAWGDVHGPFQNADEESYEQRIRADFKNSDGGTTSAYKAMGASTLPASALKLPDGCRVKLIGEDCVICTSGCLMCWNDAKSFQNAECQVF